MAFDPDAYLSGGTAVKEFDPDAYLAADVPSLDPQVVTPEDETLSDRIKQFLFEPEGAKTLREGIQGAVEAIPHMAVDTAKMGYKGLRMAMGTPEERVKIMTEDVIPSALQQGQQTAADIQSPFGTSEWLRGATQLGMMAAPGLELARELRAPVEIPREIPPVQVEPTLAERITSPRVEPVVEESLAPVTPEVPLEPPVQAPEMPVNVPEPMVPSPVAEAAPPAPVVSPGAAKQLRKLKAHKAQVEAIGGKVDPDKVTAKIAEIEGVPPEAPVLATASPSGGGQAPGTPSIASEAPGGVPVAETPVGAAEPPTQGAGMTRVYRGGVKGREGEWFSTERDTAEFHQQNAAYDGPARLSYVDIPTVDLVKYQDAAAEHPSVLGGGNIVEANDLVLPPKLSRSAQTLHELPKIEPIIEPPPPGAGVVVEDLIGAKGAYQPVTGKTSLDKATIAKMSPEERASLVRHELAHKIETETGLWQQTDTALWDLWKNDPKHPIWDFMQETTGRSKFDNEVSPEILANLYAEHHPKGTFTVRERPYPREGEEGGVGPFEFPIPEPIKNVLDQVEGKLGIWGKKQARGTAEPPPPGAVDVVHIGEKSPQFKQGETAWFTDSPETQAVYQDPNHPLHWGQRAGREPPVVNKARVTGNFLDVSAPKWEEHLRPTAEKLVTNPEKESRGGWWFDTPKGKRYSGEADQAQARTKVSDQLINEAMDFTDEGGEVTKIHNWKLLEDAGFTGIKSPSIIGEGFNYAVRDPKQIQLEPPPPGAGAPPEVPPSERGYAGMEPLPPEKTGISKAAISEQREARGVPEIERQKQIDFGESLDRAKATLAEDPMAGQRLVDQLTAKPRSVTPEDTPLLIERMQQVQREFDKANKAVNEATPEQLEVAKARLEHARGEYDKTVTATQNATSSTGAGLNSVKMILKEDYSLARMQSRKRAANNGKIDEGQLKEVEALHAKIADLTDRMDALDRQRFGFRDVGKEAVAARKSGKRLIDYTGEAANKARERIQRQLHGLGAKPAPPTLLYDYAVVGADHLARGLTKFSDWSAQMLKEFGEKVKPHLQDLWKMARAVHDKTAKAFRSPEEVRLERYKTRMAQDTAGVTAKIQRGDFAKTTRQKIVLDKAAYKMKGNLQRLKNEFERGVAKDAYRKMSKGDKFWQHFVGVERAMKLSSPAVFEKLGLAAMVREVLAPVEAAGGYAVSKVFPRLAKGTRYGADLKTITRAEIKAKAALFTEGMKDSWENIKGKETTLEAISDKYGRQPDFWYNRIGKIHAAVKAPVKRAEFVRSLETRMDAAVKAGEDINHPEVMDRLATESALDANRAIFQQNTVVSKFFSQLDRLSPAGGRTARFLFPVIKIPVNLFKELVTYNVGAPVALTKIGRAYWKGVETLEPVARESIIRQLTKGSVGGAALLWGYWKSKEVHDFLESMPPWFEHTPVAMAIHEGSIIKELESGDTKKGMKDLQKMAKYDIPFMYTVTGLASALDPRDPNGWRKYLYGMIQGTVVPQAVSWTAKELDKPTPFNITDRPAYRQPRNVVEAVTQGIPGLREQIPAKEFKEKKEPSVSQRLKAKKAARTRARKKAREED